MGGKKETKAAYFEKLETLLKEYKSIFIVPADARDPSLPAR
jgi:large subunit ribosomal protein LP0